MIAEGYLPVVQTGLQTLCIIAAGRLAASRGLFDPTPVCRTLNRFVVVACLPALQFWLLAIKTDMRNMEHWRAVGAFMLWTLLVQMGCAAWVFIFEGGKLSRICVHSLILAANNTGILAPVVLEAAVGSSSAAVGMLATIVLYFQQLPVAMVLFELDRMAERARECSSIDTTGGCREEVGISGVSHVYHDSKASVGKLCGCGPEAGVMGVEAGAWKAAAGAGWARLKGCELCGCGCGCDYNRWVVRKGALCDMLGPRQPSPGPTGHYSQVGSLSTSTGAAVVVAATAAAAATSGGCASLISPGDGFTPGPVCSKLLSSHGSAELRVGTLVARPSIVRSITQRAWIISPVMTVPSACGHHVKSGCVASGGTDIGRSRGPEQFGTHRLRLRTASCAETVKDGVAGGGPVDVDNDIKATTATAAVDGHCGVVTAAGYPRTLARCTLVSCDCRRLGDYEASTAAIPTSPSVDIGVNSHGLSGAPNSHLEHQHRQLQLPSAQHHQHDQNRDLQNHHRHYHHHHHDCAGLRQSCNLSPQDPRAVDASTVVLDSSPAIASTAVVVDKPEVVAETRTSAAHGGGSGPGFVEPSMRHAVQLVLGNGLMWTTGAATAVSMLGLHAVLDPDVPSHIPELGFVEGTLAWLARCSVPVSLFAIGLFTASRPGCGVTDARSLRTLMAYLAVKLLLLPCLMVFVNSLLGLDGRLAQSLVVLTCVPVGQNAFLVTEQFGEGAEAVTAVMQTGLMVMLPHVAAVMAALRWMGLYQAAVA